MDQPFLELEGLFKDFGGLRAIDNVGFSMNGTEMVGLIGPNGAGKTTLLQLITGILRPATGAATYGSLASPWLLRTCAITSGSVPAQNAFSLAPVIMTTFISSISSS